MNSDGRINRYLPFKYYFWIVAGIATIGLVDALYLSLSHYRVHMDMGYMSFCAISKALNCDTVSQSQYAVFLEVPLAVWGVVGYTFFLCLLYIAGKQKPQGQCIWPSLFIISMLFSLLSILLAAISSFYIKSYCLMCILSFGVNFLLFYFVWMVRKRFDSTGLKHTFNREIQFWKEKNKTGGRLALVFTLICCCLIIFYPKYWDYNTIMSADVKTGITEDGHPWIGATNPTYTITEYTDYQCFQCKKMHSYLRLIVAKHSQQIRLVHRHFPMDHKINPIVKKPYHLGSAKMALIAIYSASQGKFWEMNDKLFKLAMQKETLNIKEIADDIGLDISEISNPEVEKKILENLVDDINDGISLGIEGTPGYLFEGKVFSGQLPPEIIKKITDQK